VPVPEHNDFRHACCPRARRRRLNQAISIPRSGATGSPGERALTWLDGLEKLGHPMCRRSVAVPQRTLSGRPPAGTLAARPVRSPATKLRRGRASCTRARHDGRRRAWTAFAPLPEAHHTGSPRPLLFSSPDASALSTPPRARPQPATQAHL
jgi:hypothetical protein